MPKELFRHDGPLEWLQTVIRKCGEEIETEIHLRTTEGLLTIFTDSVPSRHFLVEVMWPKRIAICEYTLEERGWIHGQRYEIRNNDVDDDEGFSIIEGSCVRWDPQILKSEVDNDSFDFLK